MAAGADHGALMTRRTDHWRRLTNDVGVARVVLWLWIVLWTVDISTEAVLPGERWAAWGVCVVMLAWDASRHLLGRLTLIPAVALVLSGLLMTSNDLILSGRVALAWGIAAVAVLLPWRLAVPATLLLLGSATWLVVSLAPASALPSYLLGLLSQMLLPFLLLRISITARRLRSTQEELARTEVDAERDRLAEDLNALIGQTLHQVAHQITEARSAAGHRHPDLQDQLADIDVLVRRGLDQLRLLSHEPVIDDLDTEVSTAQTLCERLGVSFTAAVDEVDDAVTRTCGLLLRESVTNMFKHAVPTRCTVVARTEEDHTLFSFTNDGAADSARPGPTGTGQSRWRAAVDEIGGTLETGPLGEGRYRVLARIPSHTRPTASFASDSPERNPHHA